MVKNKSSIIITLEGIAKIQAEKKKTVWTIFLSPMLQENGGDIVKGFSIMKASYIKHFISMG